MTLRWCAAGMNEAAKQFRRVNGHLHLAALRVALDARFRDRHTHARDSRGRLTNTRTVTQVPQNATSSRHDGHGDWNYTLHPTAQSALR